MRKKHLLLTSLWLVVSSFFVNPIPISVKDILKSVQKDQRISNIALTDNLSESVNNRLPILKDLGFKYGTDDLTDAKQQYAIALGFNSFKMIKEQQSINTAQFNLYQAKRTALLRDLMMERYTDITDFHFAKALINTNHSLENLLKKKNTILKTSLENGISIKIKDLVETEEDLKELENSLTKMNGLLMVSQQKIQNYLGIQKAFVLDVDNFITIDKLKETLLSIKKNKNLVFPDLHVSDNKIQLAEAEMRLEEAAHKQIFEQFQLTYERKAKQEDTSRDFAFRLGFNIPLKSGLKAKQNKLVLELKEAEDDRQFVLYNTYKQIKTLVFKIENLIEQYEANQALVSSGFSYTILNTPEVAATLSPSDIMDLKIIQHKKSNTLIKLRYELVKEYIKLLDLTGCLIDAPYKNYLSNTLEQC